MNLAAAIDRWLFRVMGPERGPIELTQRRVFVLPTRAGTVYGGILLLMLTASINYSLSLGYLLTFLLAGLGVVAILHTFRNLVHLRIETGRTPPAFAGGRATFELAIEGPCRQPRFAISVGLRTKGRVTIDVPADSSARVVLDAPAATRGWQRMGRVTLSTRYPLGLVRAWSYIEPDARCLVYPCPESDPPPLPVCSGWMGEGQGTAAGSDDFAGLRGHQPADSPRHIAWKALARDRPLLTKQFSGALDEMLYLDWAQTPEALGEDARLARLAAWVLEARRLEKVWALRLPRRDIAPASGDAHLHNCLKALALHGMADET